MWQPRFRYGGWRPAHRRIERRRLPSSADRTYRIEPDDIRATANEAHLSGVKLANLGPRRYVELPSTALVVEGDGTLAEGVDALKQIDALGGLIGDVHATSTDGKSFHYQLYVYILSR